MRFLFSLIVVFFFLSRQIASAHDGKAAFQVTFNGKPTIPNDIELSVPSSDFIVTEDTAQDKFLVNQPILFEVLHEEEHDPFIWKFSDGQTFSLESGQIVFSKPGTYIATIEQGKGEKIKSHTVLLHVIPHKEYKLPTASISSGEKDLSFTKVNTVDLSTKVPLDATRSTSETRSNKYLWYLDNGEIAEGEKIIAIYPKNPFLTTPVIRVIDENGIYTDAQFSLKNIQRDKNSKISLLPLVGVTVGLGIVIFLTIFLYFRRKK